MKNKNYGGDTIHSEIRHILSDIVSLKNDISNFHKLQIDNCETNLTSYKTMFDKSTAIVNHTQILLEDLLKKHEKTEYQICSRVIHNIHLFKQLKNKNNNKNKSILKIATYANFPPIVGFNDGKPFGFEVELVKLIFDAQFLKQFFTSELYLEFIKIDNYDKIWTIPEDCTLSIGGFSKTIQRNLAIEESGKKYIGPYRIIV